jgi:hypothetical protein
METGKPTHLPERASVERKFSQAQADVRSSWRASSCGEGAVRLATDILAIDQGAYGSRTLTP